MLPLEEEVHKAQENFLRDLGWQDSQMPDVVRWQSARPFYVGRLPLKIFQLIIIYLFLVGGPILVYRWIRRINQIGRKVAGNISHISEKYGGYVIPAIKDIKDRFYYSKEVRQWVEWVNGSIDEQLKAVKKLEELASKNYPVIEFQKNYLLYLQRHAPPQDRYKEFLFFLMDTLKEAKDRYKKFITFPYIPTLYMIDILQNFIKIILNDFIKKSDENLYNISKQNVIKTLPYVKNFDCAIVLGAGRCNDIPLVELAKRFKEVVLIDRDKEALQAARNGVDKTHPELSKKITLKVKDLTRGMSFIESDSVGFVIFSIALSQIARNIEDEKSRREMAEQLLKEILKIMKQDGIVYFSNDLEIVVYSLEGEERGREIAYGKWFRELIEELFESEDILGKDKSWDWFNRKELLDKTTNIAQYKIYAWVLKSKKESEAKLTAGQSKHSHKEQKINLLKRELISMMVESIKSRINEPGREIKKENNPSFGSHNPIISILEKLDIKLDLEQDKIFGRDVKEWLRKYGLFYSEPPSRNLYEEKEARRFASNIYKLKVSEIREELLKFAKSIKQEKEIRGRLKGRRTKGSLYPLIMWMAKIKFVTQERQKREGKLFAKIDITGMKLIDLPIWPIDKEGNILEDLIKWMAIQNKSPPFEYYQAKKVSLRQLLGEKSDCPKESKINFSLKGYSNHTIFLLIAIPLIAILRYLSSVCFSINANLPTTYGDILLTSLFGIFIGFTGSKGIKVKCGGKLRKGEAEKLGEVLANEKTDGPLSDLFAWLISFLKKIDKRLLKENLMSEHEKEVIKSQLVAAIETVVNTLRDLRTQNEALYFQALKRFSDSTFSKGFRKSLSWILFERFRGIPCYEDKDTKSKIAGQIWIELAKDVDGKIITVRVHHQLIPILEYLIESKDIQKGRINVINFDLTPDIEENDMPLEAIWARKAVEAGLVDNYIWIKPDWAWNFTASQDEERIKNAGDSEKSYLKKMKMANIWEREALRRLFKRIKGPVVVTICFDYFVSEPPLSSKQPEHRPSNIQIDKDIAKIIEILKENNMNIALVINSESYDYVPLDKMAILGHKLKQAFTHYFSPALEATRMEKKEKSPKGGLLTNAQFLDLIREEEYKRAIYATKDILKLFKTEKEKINGFIEEWLPYLQANAPPKKLCVFLLKLIQTQDSTLEELASRALDKVKERPLLNYIRDKDIEEILIVNAIDELSQCKITVDEFIEFLLVFEKIFGLDDEIEKVIEESLRRKADETLLRIANSRLSSNLYLIRRAIFEILSNAVKYTESMFSAAQRYKDDVLVYLGFNRLGQILKFLEDYIKKSGKINGPPYVAYRENGKVIWNLEPSQILSVVISIERAVNGYRKLQKSLRYLLDQLRRIFKISACLSMFWIAGFIPLSSSFSPISPVSDSWHGPWVVIGLGLVGLAYWRLKGGKEEISLPGLGELGEVIAELYPDSKEKFNQIVENIQSLEPTSILQVFKYERVAERYNRLRKLLELDSPMAIVDEEVRLLKEAVDAVSFIPRLKEEREKFEAVLKVWTDNSGRIKFPYHPIFFNLGEGFRNSLLTLQVKEGMIKVYSWKNVLFQVSIEDLIQDMYELRKPPDRVIPGTKVRIQCNEFPLPGIDTDILVSSSPNITSEEINLIAQGWDAVKRVWPDAYRVMLRFGRRVVVRRLPPDILGQAYKPDIVALDFENIGKRMGKNAIAICVVWAHEAFEIEFQANYSPDEIFLDYNPKKLVKSPLKSPLERKGVSGFSLFADLYAYIKMFELLWVRIYNSLEKLTLSQKRAWSACSSNIPSTEIEKAIKILKGEFRLTRKGKRLLRGLEEIWGRVRSYKDFGSYLLIALVVLMTVSNLAGDKAKLVVQLMITAPFLSILLPRSYGGRVKHLFGVGGEESAAYDIFISDQFRRQFENIKRYRKNEFKVLSPEEREIFNVFGEFYVVVCRPWIPKKQKQKQKQKQKKEKQEKLEKLSKELCRLSKSNLEKTQSSLKNLRYIFSNLKGKLKGLEEIGEHALKKEMDRLTGQMVQALSILIGKEKVEIENHPFYKGAIRFLAEVYISSIDPNLRGMPVGIFYERCVELAAEILGLPDRDPYAGEKQQALTAALNVFPSLRNGLKKVYKAMKSRSPDFWNQGYNPKGESPGSNRMKRIISHFVKIADESRGIYHEWKEKGKIGSHPIINRLLEDYKEQLASGWKSRPMEEYLKDVLIRRAILKILVLLIIAGNKVDLGHLEFVERMEQPGFNFKVMISADIIEVFSQGLYIDQLDELLYRIEQIRMGPGRPRKVIIAADNWGLEAIAEFLMAEFLSDKYFGFDEVVIAGRESYILNDSTMEELLALYEWLRDKRLIRRGKDLKIISTGYRFFGIPKDRWGTEFRQEWEESSLIIAVGQGNLESTCELKEGRSTLVNVLRLKYPERFQGMMNIKPQSNILLVNPPFSELEIRDWDEDTKKMTRGIKPLDECPDKLKLLRDRLGREGLSNPGRVYVSDGFDPREITRGVKINPGRGFVILMDGVEIKGKSMIESNTLLHKAKIEGCNVKHSVIIKSKVKKRGVEKKLRRVTGKRIVEGRQERYLGRRLPSIDLKGLKSLFLRRPYLGALRKKGVIVIDPKTIFIDPKVKLEKISSNVLIYPFVVIEGEQTSIGEGAVIGPGAHLINVKVAPRGKVSEARVSFMEIGEGERIRSATEEGFNKLKQKVKSRNPQEQLFALRILVGQEKYFQASVTEQAWLEWIRETPKVIPYFIDFLMKNPLENRGSLLAQLSYYLILNCLPSGERLTISPKERIRGVKVLIGLTQRKTEEKGFIPKVALEAMKYLSAAKDELQERIARLKGWQGLFGLLTWRRLKEEQSILAKLKEELTEDSRGINRPASRLKVMPHPEFLALEESLGRTSLELDLKKEEVSLLEELSREQTGILRDIKGKDFDLALFLTQELKEALRRIQETKPLKEKGSIPVEICLSTASGRLAEVVVKDGVRKIIFSWAIITRGPPSILSQITLLEEILHYYYPTQDEFIHSLVDKYIVHNCYKEFIDALREARRQGIGASLLWRFSVDLHLALRSLNLN
jgi:uncharacterized protein with ATP-grasp and redox domains/acetyltransferase-like isoleucine patch superfamily enzyme/signal transduction histidine kinase